MNKVAILGLVGLLVFGAVGCGGASEESLKRQIITATNELADALERKDVNAAKRAAEKLKALQQQADALERENVNATNAASEKLSRALDKVAGDAEFDKLLKDVGVGPLGGHDRVMKEMIAAMNSLADALDKKDFIPARAALERMKQLKKQAKILKDPPQAQQQELMTKYGPELMAAGLKFAAAQAKVAGDEDFIKLLKEFDDALR